jgi:ankyrin repeat protein
MNAFVQNYLLISVWFLLLVVSVGCGHQETDYEKAARAIYNRDTNLLGQIVATNQSVLSETSGFDGATLLHDALVNTPTIDCARILISSGIDINKPDVTGKTPLHLLCEYSANVDAIRLLLTYAMNVNARDKSGKTALFYAKNNAQAKEAVLLLENNGAKD